MGGLLSVCPRRSPGLSDLGIPGEYEFEGLAEDLIDKYYEAKDRVLEELEKSSGKEVDPEDPSWAQQISVEIKEMLKGALLRRAIGLVHVLKPVEEQRRGIRTLSMKGMLPDNHMASFDKAEELCQQELKSLMEESRVLVPEAPPNGIIQAAVREYHAQRAQEDEEGEGGKSFENVKRGFLQGGSDRPAPQLCHGFEIGAEVEAHSLSTAAMNGNRGKVEGISGDRVAVAFPPPIGKKSLKPQNLKLAPRMPDIHPDATEAPVTQFQVVMERALKEDLGLSFEHEPPLEHQKPGMESVLCITGLLPDGFASKYNATQQDKNLRLRPGDRILGVMNGMVPESKRKSIGGNSKLILDVIKSGVAPLLMLVGRMLGPPLRFQVGQRVKANCGERGWLVGIVIKVWEEEEDGRMIPYVIGLRETDGVVCARVDSDNFVEKADPLFKVGDACMARQEDGYKKVEITEVKNESCLTTYAAKGQSGMITIPEELAQFVRPVARFSLGDEVLVKMSKGYVPGKVEAMYHPNWVYAVALEDGHTAYVPEDLDAFVKKK